VIPLRIAILTFEGFNELDSFIALGILNRVKLPGWRAVLACPSPSVTSMNGVTVEAQCSLVDASAADAVIVGSGINTRNISNDNAQLSQLNLDPARQLIGAQCSGTLLLAKLGLLTGTRLHGFDLKALGAGGGRRSLEPAVLRQRQRRHCGRMLVVAISRRVDHRAQCRSRRGGTCAALRCAGGRERTLCHARDERCNRLLGAYWLASHSTAAH